MPKTFMGIVTIFEKVHIFTFTERVAILEKVHIYLPLWG